PGPTELRWGLSRVKSVLDHPILFGTVTGSIISLVHLVLGYQKGFFQRSFKTCIVGATSMLSLSSGPLASIATQAFLLSWEQSLKNVRTRWKILIGLLVFIVLTIELIFKRSVLEIVLGRLLFDPLSYWFRLLIWTYGWAAALNNPLFGVGI